MNKNEMPLLEFDPEYDAHINPEMIHDGDHLPERCVMHFFAEVTPMLYERYDAREAYVLNSAMGEHPVQVIEVDGVEVAVFHQGVGAPLAAAFMEELIAIGARKFIAVGDCGVLYSDMPAGGVILPTEAFRDEGTSYHYLPADIPAKPHPEGVAAIKNTLQYHQVPFVEGRIWTTDAIFRETPAKISRRRDENGCIAVEMEAAAFFAVAQHRDVVMAQLLYGGDDVGGDVWDSRDRVTGQMSTREKLFTLALESCLKL